MSDDIANAAATAAAAGVEAVQNDQAEAERAASMEASTVDANLAAQEATERAEEAAEAANAAAEAANDATDQAGAASAVATDAAEAAYDARAHIDQVREEMAAGWRDLREFISSRIPERPSASDEPTEVVVTHEQSNANPAPEQHSDTGSGGSTSATGDIRRGRHRFGTHRG
jgi:hypothetical protein